MSEPASLRVLVCGGRDYRNRDFIHNTLVALDAERGPIACVIHGAATGADDEAMIWAQMMGRVKHAPFAAEWERYGKAAGPIRNQRMLDQGKPDLILAFPGGKGTADMIRRAKAAGIEIIAMSEERTSAPNQGRAET